MVKKSTRPPLTIFTVGHSTRTLDEFIRTLRSYGVKQLIDVRTIPRSRHNPQFNRETLGKYLRSRRLNYRHMADLGGLRRARADSTLNSGWRNASFRGFADYMQTTEFEEGLQKLLALSQKRPTAIMCAEAVPWRCHRSMIADALTVHGISVQEIFSATNVRRHTLNGMAAVRGHRITYPIGRADAKIKPSKP